ncbi:MAG: hypothetical protein LHV68_04675 [Elusimicrobia bacterium]|nr:hypothetical protein [Candidatus Liberimonas magnetica]
MGFFPLDEIKRKTFHFLTIIYILAYWFLPYRTVIWGMAALIVIVILGETLRKFSPTFNVWILKALGGVHREEEINKISGLPWTISGSFLTMLIFPDKQIVLVSLLYLAFGDAAAALFGKKYGKRKVYREKTLEGSISCFIVCLIIGLFFLNFKLAIIGALLITVIELYPWPLNDNFWIPIIAANILTYLNRFF